MTTVLIIIFICLFFIYLLTPKNKSSDDKTRHPENEIPHSSNSLYDSTEINAVGIDDPILDLSAVSKVPDIKIHSSIDTEKTYVVSVAKMTCSCPDFTKTRKSFNLNDPRRGCKHLVAEFANNDLLKQQDELSRIILLSPTRGDLATFQMENGMIFSLAFESTGWVSVFIRRRRKGEKSFFFTGKYERYGYSLHENRWSYGDTPAGSKYLKDAIRKTLDYINNDQV